MKKARHTDGQILRNFKLYEYESGTPVPDVCREYGSTDVALVKCMKEYDYEIRKVGSEHSIHEYTTQENISYLSHWRGLPDFGGPFSFMLLCLGHFQGNRQEHGAYECLKPR